MKPRKTTDPVPATDLAGKYDLGEGYQISMPNLAGLLAHYAALPATEGSPPMATWDITTDAGIARLHQATEGAGVSTLWDACETSPAEIVVCDLAVVWRSHESEEHPGEIIAGPALTLIGPTGRSWGIGISASEWAFRSLQRLASLGIRPPYDPPIRLRASRQPTRNRTVRLAIEYLGRAPEGVCHD